MNEIKLLQLIGRLARSDSNIKGQSFWTGCTLSRKFNSKYEIPKDYSITCSIAPTIPIDENIDKDKHMDEFLKDLKNKLYFQMKIRPRSNSCKSVVITIRPNTILEAISSGNKGYRKEIRQKLSEKFGFKNLIIVNNNMIEYGEI